MAKNKYPMQGQAEKLAKQGRYGDSMLVHMNPAEVDILRKTSPIGDLTTNPQTGQPEAFAQFIPAILGTAGALMSKSKQRQTDESMPVVQPSASQQYAAPGIELTSRQLLDAYFNPEYGMIRQQIPIPVQQVAGLSPLEVQARNLSQGLGGFGQQLSEAQNLFRQSARGFDPRSAGAFADPRARALYEQSLGVFDPRMGQQFIDQQARGIQTGAAGDIRGAQSMIPGAVGEARRGLERAGRMGVGSALRGIAGLRGTGGQFDPSGIGGFMDPFTQNVIDAQQAEIARLGEQQKIAARDQAVRSGAFGGSRGAIAQAEIGRNVLQQQAKTGAELRSQGFQQAQQAAQQAFEQAQGRRQQAAQLTGQLGQAGAQTALSAAQQAGQLGLSGAQGLGSLAAQRAGIGADIGRQFQAGQQLGSGIFSDRMGRIAGAAGGLDRLSRGAFGDALSAFQAGQQGARAGAQGIAGLGRQGFDMLTGQIGTMSDLGGIGRGVQQRGLDAQYKAATQMADEPFMRLQRGFNVLGQGAQFMPGYTTGFGSGQQAVGTYQQPNTAARIMGALSFGSNFMPTGG